MKLYAYCLGGEEMDAATLARSGVEGATVRLMRCGDILVAVSDFEGERASVTRENALAHNAVVASVLALTTPLPFRFGTLTSAVALEGYVQAQREALRAGLRRVRGCVEMNVKILWDAEARRGAAAKAAAAAATSAASAAKGVAAHASRPGTAFLAAKRGELAGGERLRAEAEELAAWLAVAVGGAARETRVRLRPEEALVVRAAHLVERAGLEDYRERVRAAREERGGDLRFLTSGAWPPYSFSDVLQN